MMRDRILILDATRGLAVLGILLCNVTSFSHADALGLDFPHRWPHPANSASEFVWWLIETVFDKRFVTLFSMLFGVSLFLVGGERRDTGRSPVLHRRLFWLAIFGLIHGALVWRGDILLDYAAVGAVIMLCRSWSPRRLLTAGIAFFTALHLLAIWGNLYSAIGSHFSPDYPNLGRDIAAQTSAFAGDFRSSLVANLISWRSTIVRGLVSGVLLSAPMMLIGLGLFKLGFFSGRLSRQAYMLFVGAGALALICIAGATTADVAAAHSQPTGFEASFFRDLLAPVVSLGYAGALCLALGGRGEWLLRLLAPVGHMAFTNYLTQSLIMTAIFYGGRGLDLFGHLDRPALALIVAATWLVQVAWSHLWLKRYPSGPFEWVWRRLYRRSGDAVQPPIAALPA